MTSLALIPFALQAAVMLADELHFHRLRGLPRWERIGHPLDTASVLACYALLLLTPPSSTMLVLYVALGAFSCLLVTKDELVHARYCSPAEHWLHALLFVLHPIVLGTMGVLWWFAGARTLIAVQTGLTLAFGFYQFAYWNFPWPSRSRAR